MKTPINIPNFSIEDKEILKEQLQNSVKELSNFFNKEKIEEIAKETKFVERESKLTGLLFLSLFVFGVNIYGNPTLEELIGLLNTYVEGLTLSRPGLHQRINAQAVAFFERMLSLALDHTIPDCLKINLPAQFASIQIWDSTAFELPPALAPFFPGKGGSASPAGAKIQFCYDLCQHKWDFVLQSDTQSDNSMATEIIAHAQPGTLVLQDLGYFNIETFAALDSKSAYYLSRFKHNTFIFQQNETGEFCGKNLVTFVRQQWFTTKLDIAVFIRSKPNVFTPTRLIIERLPKQVADERLSKLQNEALSRGRQLSAETIFLARFNFYVTNAPTNLLPASCCRFLYAIRWQVELVFKTWKSNLLIHKINVKHRPERASVTILAKLIFITLTAKLIRMDTAFLWLSDKLEISYFRAMRHFKIVAQQWFSYVVSSRPHAIFELLINALDFIALRSFKIPQRDRVYPMERLQMIENTYIDTLALA